MKLNILNNSLKNSQFYKTASNVFDNDLSNIFKHAKNYFLATLALKIASLFAIPLFTRYLTTEEYGMVALFNSYLSIVIITFPLYLYAAIGRYYFESTSDFDEFVGTSLLLSVGTYVVSFISLLFLPFNIFSFGTSTNILFYLLFLAGGMKIISGIYYLILIPKRDSSQLAKMQISEGYLNIMISVVLVIFLPQKKYYGPIIGIFFSSFTIFVYSLLNFSKFIKVNIKWAHVKYILLYSLPQLPYALSGVLNEQLGRILIGKTKNFSDLGIYSLGFQISALYIIITSALRTALLPDFYKFMNSKEYSKITILRQKIIMLSMLPASFIMTFSKELIRLLAPENYYDSYLIVPFIIIGYVFFDLFYVYSPYLEYKKHTGVLSFIIVIGAVLNVIIGYYFVSKIGYIGAAYAFTLVYFTIFILTWVILKLFYKIQIVNLFIIIKPIIAIIFFAATIYFVDSKLTNIFVWFFLRLITLIIFIFFYVLKPLLLIPNQSNVQAKH